MLYMSRHILARCAEMRCLEKFYAFKPVKGDWDGTGSHANYPTKAMRQLGGYDNVIIPAIAKFSINHAKHIDLYGTGNKERLTGKHETAIIDTFRWVWPAVAPPYESPTMWPNADTVTSKKAARLVASTRTRSPAFCSLTLN